MDKSAYWRGWIDGAEERTKTRIMMLDRDQYEAMETAWKNTYGSSTIFETWGRFVNFIARLGGGR